MRRNFNAGIASRLTESWTTTSLTSDETLRLRLRVLRARSREQAENNDYVKRFLHLNKANVLGPKGIMFQAKTTRQNGKPDEPANKALEHFWQEWGRKGNCDMTGGLTWMDCQSLFLSTVLIDGECLVRLIVGPSAGPPYYFKLQFIDPELLDVEYNEVLSHGRFIRMGIEFDSWSKPIAYHILDVDAYDVRYQYSGRKYIRIPANEIIHEFLRERIGQKRGIPRVATTLMRLNMLNGYEEAALVNARHGASKMGFYTMPAGEGYQGDDKDSAGNLITNVEPGTMEQLPYGVDFKPYDPSYPDGEFPNFVKSILRGISSGLNVSYNTLANDLEGVNFSSMRSGVMADRDVWEGEQQWIISVFCERVYKQALQISLALGIIKIGNAPLIPGLEAKYMQVKWQPRSWKWVDPLKDIMANAEAINLRTRSVSSVIREQGEDPDEVFAEIAKEKEIMKSLGIESNDVIKAKNTLPKDDEGKDDDDEDKK